MWRVVYSVVGLTAMNVTYKDQTYTVRTEAELIALALALLALEQLAA